MWIKQFKVRYKQIFILKVKSAQMALEFMSKKKFMMNSKESDAFSGKAQLENTI